VLACPNNISVATTHGFCLLGSDKPFQPCNRRQNSQMYTSFVVVCKGTVLSTARHAQRHKLLARHKVNKNRLYLGNPIAQDYLRCQYPLTFSPFLFISEFHCLNAVERLGNLQPHKTPQLAFSLSQERETECEWEGMGFLLSTALS